MQSVQFYLIVLSLLTIVVYSAASKADLEFAYKVYQELIKARGGKDINYSPNLAKIAQLHAEDLKANHNIKNKYCNMHSWYTSGGTSCCYTEDHNMAQCMWDKPSQFSNYKDNGYEVAYYGKETHFGPKDVISGFLGSQGHRVVILNQGDWTEPWKAVGVGHSGDYSTIWFGREEDKDANGNFKYPVPGNEEPKYTKKYQTEIQSSATSQSTSTSTSTSTYISVGTSTYESTSTSTSQSKATTYGTTTTMTITASSTPTPTSSQSSTTSSSPTLPTDYPNSKFKGGLWYRHKDGWIWIPKLKWVDNPNDKNYGGYHIVDDY